MKNLKFKKKVNVETLTAELKAAGFDTYGASNSEDNTVIHLKDSEKKDPKNVVEVHKFTELEFPKPKTFKEQVEEVLTEKGLI